MFETNDCTEIPMLSAVSEPGQHIWTSVTMRIHVPWFHVVYSMDHSNECVLNYITFLTSPSLLAELNRTQGIKVIEASIVSPGHINNQGRWAMEPITEHEQEAIIYVLQNGSRYIDSALDTPEEKLLNPVLVYKA